MNEFDGTEYKYYITPYNPSPNNQHFFSSKINKLIKIETGSIVVVVFFSF
jgi:hypothetical protein